MLLKFASASTQLSNDPLPCYLLNTSSTTLLLRPFHRTVLMVTSVSTATAWHLFSDENQTYAHSLRQISRHIAKTASYQHDAALQLRHNSHPSHNLPKHPTLQFSNVSWGMHVRGFCICAIKHRELTRQDSAGVVCRQVGTSTSKLQSLPNHAAVPRSGLDHLSQLLTMQGSGVCIPTVKPSSKVPCADLADTTCYGDHVLTQQQSVRGGTLSQNALPDRLHKHSSAAAQHCSPLVHASTCLLTISAQCDEGHSHAARERKLGTWLTLQSSRRIALHRAQKLGTKPVTLQPRDH